MLVVRDCENVDAFSVAMPMALGLHGLALRLPRSRSGGKKWPGARKYK